MFLVGLRVRLSEGGQFFHQGCTNSKLFLKDTGTITKIVPHDDYGIVVLFDKHQITHNFRKSDLLPFDFSKADFEL